MNLLTATAIPLFVLASAQAEEATSVSGAGGNPRDNNAQSVTITRNGAQPSSKGAAEYFTGAARIDRLFEVRTPSRTGAASVTFEPGARTAWHSHPLGQFLIVTAGTGWVQQDGGEKQEMKPGDVVWIPAGVKHWHGATGSNGMTHIAIQEASNGKVVDWMEQVSDEQYRR